MLLTAVWQATASACEKQLPKNSAKTQKCMSLCLFRSAIVISFVPLAVLMQISFASLCVMLQIYFLRKRL